MHDKVAGAVCWSLCESNGVDSNDTGIRLNQSHRLNSVTRSSATADKPRVAFLPHAPRNVLNCTSGRTRYSSGISRVTSNSLPGMYFRNCTLLCRTLNSEVSKKVLYIYIAHYVKHPNALTAKVIFKVVGNGAFR